jgi:hypothetical protein
MVQTADEVPDAGDNDATRALWLALINRFG